MTTSNIIIFSVFRPEFKDVNEKNHRAVINTFNALGVVTTEVNGFYKGDSEKSILVANNAFNESQVLMLAKLFNQESVLMTDNNSQASLVFMNDLENIVDLGTLTVVPMNEAVTQDNYTHIIESDIYLITK